MAYRQAEVYARDLKDEIIERQRAEKALRRQTTELQARNEELDAFAHTVAHDLKNPLGPIIGYAEFAQKKPLNPFIRRTPSIYSEYSTKRAKNAEHHRCLIAAGRGT